MNTRDADQSLVSDVAIRPHVAYQIYLLSYISDNGWSTVQGFLPKAIHMLGQNILIKKEPPLLYYVASVSSSGIINLRLFGYTMWETVAAIRFTEQKVYKMGLQMPVLKKDGSPLPRVFMRLLLNALTSTMLVLGVLGL